MYKVILSFRYMFKKRISYLALGAVALCVFIVVVVMTVMTGLLGDFKRKNHSFVGDCVVGSDSLVGFPYYEDFISELEKNDFISGASPVIKGYAMVNRVNSEQNIAVEIIGIEPVRHSKVTNFARTLYHNKEIPSKVFAPAYDPNLIGCVIGIDRWLERGTNGEYPYEPTPLRMALDISCFPLTAKGTLAKAGAGEVSTKTFYYSDNSRSGLAKVDGSTIYLPLEWAQKLCMAGTEKRVNAVHIKFMPHIRLEDGCEKVNTLWEKFVEKKKGQGQASLLEYVKVQSWKEYRRMFIAAMEKEQTMLTVMFALVGLTTVFIIFVVFYMIISHKSKDIGILKSIGVSSGDVVGLFCGFAFLVGISGSAVGTIAGWRFLTHINQIEEWLFRHFNFQLWDRSLFVGIDEIPNTIDLKVIMVIILSAIAACLAGAIVPSWQAAKLKPVETLQVNQL